MQKRFVSWAAVSSLPQAKKISVDDQLQTNKEHVEKWDGILHKELPIRGKSRSIITWEQACATIPEYAQLRDMIERREFDVLLYLDRSRLGRKSSLIDTIVELCNEAGIITYATESPPDSLEPPEHNFAHKIVGAVESILAQEEVAKMQHRHEMGMAHRVRNGDFPGIVPYGWRVRYDVVNNKPEQFIEVDHEAAQIINEALDLYVNSGASKRRVKEAMIERGHPPPRGTQWTESAVAMLIRLAWRYAGYVELNVRSKKRDYLRAKSKWPALITEQIAKAVEAESKKRAMAKRSVDRGVHRFSHLVWCKRCEKRMIARYGWRQSKRDPALVKRIENYRCMHSGTPRHANYQIDGSYIDEAVYNAIHFVQSASNRQALLESYTDRTPQIHRQIDKARQRLQKNEQAIQRADDAYVLGSMSLERFQRQVENLDSQRAKIIEGIADLELALEEALSDSQRESRLLSLAGEGQKWLQSDDLAAANAWFRRHIQIWINHDGAERTIDVEYL